MSTPKLIWQTKLNKFTTHKSLRDEVPRGHGEVVLQLVRQGLRGVVAAAEEPDAVSRRKVSTKCSRASKRTTLDNSVCSKR